MSDNEELNDAMTVADMIDQGIIALSRAAGPAYAPPPPAAEVAERKPPLGALEQWTTGDGRHFMPSRRTAKELPPGLYDIDSNAAVGLYFQRITIKTEGLIRFPHTNSERVLREIATFWERRPVFEEYGLIHKRGIMLWGPPGSGKSSTIQLVLSDVVSRGGVAVRFTHPAMFLTGMRALRDIQPETPVVVLMEDLDSTIRMYDESSILNILDGVELVDRTVFLASTNYPELLGPRILNRPSRFDKRVKVGHPTPESRLIYFEHLIGKRSVDLPLAQWVEDTEGFSLAHLKELFIAVVILGDEYAEAIDTLRSMREHIKSGSDNTPAGFATAGRLEKIGLIGSAGKASGR